MPRKKKQRNCEPRPRRQRAAWKAGLVEQEDGDEKPRFGERLKKRGRGFRAKVDGAKDKAAKLRARAKARKADVREKLRDAKAKFDDAKDETAELRAKAKAAKAAWKAGLIE